MKSICLLLLLSVTCFCRKNVPPSGDRPTSVPNKGDYINEKYGLKIQSINLDYHLSVRRDGEETEVFPFELTITDQNGRTLLVIHIFSYTYQAYHNNELNGTNYQVSGIPASLSFSPDKYKAIKELKKEASINFNHPDGQHIVNITLEKGMLPWVGENLFIYRKYRSRK